MFARRHQESARHAKLAKSKLGLYEAFVEPTFKALGRRVGWSSIMSPMVHGQNKLGRRCDKSGNDVRLLDCTSFIPGKTQLDAYTGERWSCCTTVLALRFASCHGESNEGIRAHCCRPR